MKIGLVYQDLTVRGGGQRLALTQAKLLQDNGFDVTVFTGEYSPEVYPKLVKSIDLKVIPPRRGEVIARLPFFHRTISALQSASRWCPVELGEQDLLIAYTFPSNTTAYRAHVKWNIPAIWHCTHPPYSLYPRGEYDKRPTIRTDTAQIVSRLPLKILDKRAGRIFSRTLVISDKIGRRVRKIYGLPSTILFPCVDPTEFDPSVNVPASSNSIIYVGRLIWSKGPDLFLRVLKGVLSRVPDARGIMAIAGQETPSSLIEAFQQTIHRMGLQDHMELITRNGPEAIDITGLYGRAALVAYTCRDEDFGLVPLEASLCGLPSVVWDDCGCVQDGILQDNTSALVAPHYDVQEFVARVVRLLLNPSLRKELSMNARASTLRYCNPVEHVDRLKKVIRNSVLTENQESGSA